MVRINIVSWMVVSLFVLSACHEEESFDMAAYVDETMIPYFNSFQEEGEIRGVQVNFATSGITARFDALEGSIAGQCTRDATGFREIIVDPEYWRTASALTKEVVIFHELGHCYLGRAHLDESTSNGLCQSIMNSGLGNCRTNYSSRTRSDYLDELFSQ